MPKKWLKRKQIKYQSLINHYFDFLPMNCCDLISSYLCKYVPHYDFPIQKQKLLYKTRRQKFYDRHFIKGHKNYY